MIERRESIRKEVFNFPKKKGIKMRVPNVLFPFRFV